MSAQAGKAENFAGHRRVKITVIATGFGPRVPARSAATGSGAYTPVDMAHDDVGRVRPEPGVATAGAAGAGLPRLSVARRPVFDVPAAVSAPASQPANGTDLDLGLGSTFDVPAFLRRQEGLQSSGWNDRDRRGRW